MKSKLKHTERARRGGLARAAKLSSDRRREIAMRAVAARKWRPVKPAADDEWAKPTGPIEYETIVLDYAKDAFRLLDHAHRLFRPRYLLADIDCHERDRIVAGREF